MIDKSFLGLATKIELVGDDKDKVFARVRESLTRIGLAIKNEGVLTQSCYILHKRGEYYIMHYKMMRHLNGGPNRVTQDDVNLTHTVAKFLQNWNMVEIVQAPAIHQPYYGITVVKYRDRENWHLVSKCTLGQKSEK